MNSLDKFNTDQTFKSTVLRFEGVIDSLIVDNAKNAKTILIKAPTNLTLEIFEVLWKRYTDVGWNNLSWDQEAKTILIQKR